MARLNTTDEVIDRLGGTAAVAALTGRGVTSVCNWRAEDRFPANTYLVMTTALRRKRLSAPAELWSQVAPRMAVA